MYRLDGLRPADVPLLYPRLVHPQQESLSITPFFSLFIFLIFQFFNF